MDRRVRNALLGLPVLVLLAACGATPVPAATPKTPAEACADLQDAVRDFYDVASPNSTLTVLDPAALPDMNGFTIPRPSCSFEVRPDPALVAGDAFTIENFYLDYDEELTVVIQDRLADAGYKQKDPEFMNWSSKYLSRFYSASIIVFTEGDGQAYTEAADGTVLNLSVGQGA
jgi:hypothetical protein